LIARNPILEGDLSWKIIQTYADGETARWIGPPGSDSPASVTRLSESAEPVDVATGLNGGGSTSSGGTETVAAGASSDATASDSSDTLARIGVAAALLLSGAAIGGLVVTRRRSGASG
jgi:hypothetical protein